MLSPVRSRLSFVWSTDCAADTRQSSSFSPCTKAGGPRSFTKDEGVQWSVPAGSSARLGAQLQLGEGCCGPRPAVLAADSNLEQFSCFFLWLTSQSGDQEHYSSFQGWELCWAGLAVSTASLSNYQSQGDLIGKKVSWYANTFFPFSSFLLPSLSCSLLRSWGPGTFPKMEGESFVLLWRWRCLVLSMTMPSRKQRLWVSGVVRGRERDAAVLLFLV